MSAKVQRVKAKFTDFVAPELEVFESPCEHYRMRYAMLYPDEFLAWRRFVILWQYTKLRARSQG